MGFERLRACCPSERWTEGGCHVFHQRMLISLTKSLKGYTSPFTIVFAGNLLPRLHKLPFPLILDV